MPVSSCRFSRAGITDPGYSSSVPDFYLDKLARLRGHFTPMKTTCRLLTTLLLFLSVSLTAPNARAVVPPPDGGYSGFNTAEGTKALFSLTTGSANTAVGWFSLFSDTEGSFNTATGVGALLSNTADENTAFGAAALLFNTTGANNTAVGAAALQNNTGEENTATGHRALFSNTTGSFNTADGAGALYFNSTGENNTATGFQALLINTSGFGNTANGDSALRSNTTGVANTATGLDALFSNTTGNLNTASGEMALLNNTTGVANTAIGDAALLKNTTGNFNTALGNLAGSNVTTAGNVICIGSNAAGENVGDTCYIANIFGVTSAGATGVVVNSMGKLGTIVSSRRFKDEIKPMDQASEALFALQPVSFHYKKEIDPKGVPQFGLVAEDVEAVNPDLVVRDAEGKVNTVRYDAVNAMLLNEFLKEHRKVEKLEAIVADLATQLRQVSAQVQMKNSSRRVAGK